MGVVVFNIDGHGALGKEEACLSFNSVDLLREKEEEECFLHGDCMDLLEEDK